jgi:serine/threonine protein kinase
MSEQLTSQREKHNAEMIKLRQELEQCQQQSKAQHRAHTDAESYLKREPVMPQELELWELPREEVHISQIRLGTSGCGYMVRGTFRGQIVVVKYLNGVIISPQNEGRLRHEISIVSQLRHPNLLFLIGAVLTAEGPLIVTELLDRSLCSAYKGRLLEESSKVPILRDVASALTYLHSQCTPILHRDVSSANVLLEAIGHTRQWKAKLSDFESANLSQFTSIPFEGSAVYSAPELSTDDWNRQTAKIDVYSFGVLVCEVCLCRFPPERAQFPSMLSEMRHTAPNLFPLSRDCISHAHQNRPTMEEVLRRIDQI